MKAHIQKWRKMLQFFRIFLNIHDFSDFFEVFRIKTFKHSDAQTRAMHDKIRHKISHRLVYIRSLGSIGQKWFYTKNCQKIGFYAG